MENPPKKAKIDLSTEAKISVIAKVASRYDMRRDRMVFWTEDIQITWNE